MQIRFVFLFCFLLMSAFVFAQSRQERKDSLEKSQAALKQNDSIGKNLSAVDGKAIVYIVRPSSFGALVKMDLDCDSVHIGATMAERYVYTIVSPGAHTFVSRSENHAHLTLTAEGGKIYYIKQEVKMGFVIAETSLRLLDDEEGKKALSKCRLSKDNVYTN